MFQIVEHTEIDEHLGEIAENLILEHLFYTISQSVKILFSASLLFSKKKSASLLLLA